MTFLHPSSRLHSLRRLQAIGQCLREFSLYLLYLRVPVFFLLLSQAAFLSEQVGDVLLGMALEPHWSAFGFAASAAALFGITLWFSARALSELRWMAPLPLRPATPALNREAKPRVRFMPAWVVWWFPRFLGIAPPLLMALALVRGVGHVGLSFAMAWLLVLEAAALLILLYLRTRIAKAITLPSRALNRVVEALTISSGNRDGLFTPRAELVLLGLAWIVLTSFSLPMAASAYGTIRISFVNLFVLLLAGVLVLVLRRFVVGDKPPSAYWVTVAVLLVLALLLPPLLMATHLSAVALPRLLGSIAILFVSLSIFTIFASSLFVFASQSGVPLLAIVFLLALFLAANRVNDNHAVRLLAGGLAQPLPTLERTLERWFATDGRLGQIKSQAGNRKWPLYVVSSQGGGVYAAYHSSKALALLTKAVPEFRHHLFAVSGVSGGSVGAAIFENALNVAGTNDGIVDEIDANFNRDHLAPVLAAMLFPDLMQRFYPIPVAAWDRALGLELSFSDPRDQAAHVSLENSFFNAQSGPFIVLNTTIVENGRRLLLSPFTFLSDAIFHAPLAKAEAMPQQDLRFSTAAGMSARFPLISPYSFFDGSTQQRENRLVDGGYYDNSGAVTATEIKRDVEAYLATAGLDGMVEVIPIAIVNRSSFRVLDQTDRTASEIQQTPRNRIFSSTPVQALFSSRDARVLKALHDFGVQCGTSADKGLCITLETRYRLTDPHPGANNLSRSIPLGWTLSCQARSFISSQLNPDPNSPSPPLPCLPADRNYGVLEAAKSPSDSFPDFAQIVQTIRMQTASSLNS
jgi:hypothetical protein